MIKVLTRFEEARVIAARALQISMGAPVLLEDTKNLTRSDEIAKEEFEEKVLPISVVRKYPNGEEEVVNLQGEEIG